MSHVTLTWHDICELWFYKDNTDQKMWQTPKQGLKAPCHVKSLPNTPSRVKSSRIDCLRSCSGREHWKQMEVFGDNQENTLTCRKMPERPRRPPKLSEHPFFLSADVCEQDTLTSPSETLVQRRVFTNVPPLWSWGTWEKNYRKESNMTV